MALSERRIKMPASTIDDIIRLIKRRDNLSLNEARIMVDECVEEFQAALEDPNVSLDELDEIVSSQLGLEPDYTPIILEELY
jgi:hypothetical protein